MDIIDVCIFACFSFMSNIIFFVALYASTLIYSRFSIIYFTCYYIKLLFTININIVFKSANSTINKPGYDLFLSKDNCLLSILNAFFPISKANPKVNTKKKISIIINPYIPLTYAVTT